MIKYNFISEECLQEIPAFETFLYKVGFKRNEGAIFGLLVLSDRPLASEQIEEVLGLSQSAVSLALKKLSHYGAVETFENRVSEKRVKLHTVKEDSLSIVASLFRKREQETIEDVSSTYFDAYGVMRTYTFIYYINQNIILFSINPEGKIDWVKQLPKKQITTNDGGHYNSFKEVLTNEKLYFIYNDNNINGSRYIPEKEVYQNMELKKMNYVTNAYSIDISGKIEKENIFSFAELGTYIRPNNIFQISRDEVIVLARYGKNDRLISLKWEAE